MDDTRMSCGIILRDVERDFDKDRPGPAGTREASTRQVSDSRSENGIEIVIVDDPTRIGVSKTLLDGGDHMSLVAEAVELFRGDEHGCGLAALGDDSGREDKGTRHSQLPEEW